MASASAVAPSSGWGGKMYDVSRPKRKIGAGILGGRKKACPVNDNARVEAPKGVCRRSQVKRKDRLDENEYSGDSSPELDAARALTMFSLSVGERPPSPLKKFMCPKIESLSPLPQWSSKRRRCYRCRKTKSPNEDSHPSGELQPEPETETVSSLEKDLELRLASLKGEAVACGSVEQSCASDAEKASNKPQSESSCDFPQTDSRAESPISPLPAAVSLLGVVADYSVFSKGEDGERSAFQKVAPARPVKKPLLRKPKFEDDSYERAAVEQAAVKLVSRKKPKSTGLGLLPVVKTEEGDSSWTFGAPQTALDNCEIFEETKCAVGFNHLLGQDLLIDHNLVKSESKPVLKPARGKLKPAISESEKEARRQRRVQANRESARQTIKRKQEQCDGLSVKALQLVNDNDLLRQELNLKLIELRNEQEYNLKLKDQIAKNDSRGSSPSSATDSSSEKSTNVSALKYTVPPPQIAVASMHQIHPLFWYAQVCAAQAANLQPGGDLGLTLPGEYGNMVGSFALTMSPNYWVRFPQGGNMGSQASVIPSMFTHPSMVSSPIKFPMPGGEEASTTANASDVVCSAVNVSDASFVPKSCARGNCSPSMVAASYRAGTFSDSCPSDKKSVYDGSGDGSSLADKAQSLRVAPVVIQSAQPPSLGKVLQRKLSGEEFLGKASGGSHLARGSSGNLGLQLQGSRFIFSSGGRCYSDKTGSDVVSPAVMVSSSSGVKAAEAAEARRRRKELQRSRVVLHRQVSRTSES